MTTENRVSPPVAVIEWRDGPRGFLRLLDQTLLPEAVEFIDCRDVEAVWDAIKRLAVRGAPAIGVAAGYGMVLAAGKVQRAEDLPAELARAAAYLESSRPTAVNLSWAVRRVLERAGSATGDLDAMLDAVLCEAKEIHAEDQAMCLEIGRHAAGIIAAHSNILTHCNAGALATAGIGTATAGLYLAHAAGQKLTVYCDETRPLLQGSRLTSWELSRGGLDAVVITDSMAAHVMREGRIDMVIVGADRIAANGDAANKIGTYGLALAAAHHNIPFYVAAPYSTFDLALAGGADIPIEERGSEEITHGFGRATAPAGIRTYSPAFDVTPAELITAIITDRGVIQPVNAENIRRVIG